MNNPSIRGVFVTSTGQISTNTFETTQEYVQFNSFVAEK